MIQKSGVTEIISLPEDQMKEIEFYANQYKWAHESLSKTLGIPTSLIGEPGMPSTQINRLYRYFNPLYKTIETVEP